VQLFEISSGAQYVTLQKCFSHPSLVIYSFATPPITLKLGQQIGGGGTTNSKPPGPIIMMGQSETLTSSQILFITLFSVAASKLPATAICAIMLTQNYFPEPNRHILTFLHPILQCRIA
jgi:hypothetical protein